MDGMDTVVLTGVDLVLRGVYLKGGIEMPGFDGTGPLGQGARTGGGRGYCTPNSNDPDTGSVVYGVGRGRIPYGGGMGRCFGGGRRRNFAVLPPKRFNAVPDTLRRDNVATDDGVVGIRNIIKELSNRIDSLFRILENASSKNDKGEQS